MNGTQMGVLEKIQAALVHAGLEGALLVSHHNVYYASGADVVTSRLLAQKPTFVIVPSEGDCTVVVNEWDYDATKGESRIEDVRSYSGSLHVSMTAEAVREKGLGASKLGIEERYLAVGHYKELAADLPQAEFTPCDELILQIRAIKAPSEIVFLRHAAVCTERAIYATFATARAGSTEKDLADQLIGYLRNFGAATPFEPLLTAGINTTILHLLPSDKRLMASEIVHLDVGAFFSGYMSDISRNAVVGKLRPEQYSVYRRLWEMHQRLIQNVKVGTRACDLYRMYQNLSREAGFPEPISSLGHGIGLENHELPELERQNETELQAGMVLAIEPTTIIPGDARYDIEDCVLVTETGPTLLSDWRSTEDMFEI